MQRTMLAALAFLFGMSVALCQSPESQRPQTLQAAEAATFRITTREVSVDVIALRERNLPVLDLTPADLQVSEAFSPESERTDRRHSGKAPQGNPGTIKSLHIIDPNAPQHSGPDAAGGIAIGTSCLERSTPHYRLAFRPGPNGWRSGYHRVFVSTKRPGVRLYYRHHYYVGLTEPPAKPPVIESEAIEKLLFRAACYYPDTPPSISLRAG